MGGRLGELSAGRPVGLDAMLLGCLFVCSCLFGGGGGGVVVVSGVVD